MLDNLVNPVLSGITGSVQYSSSDAVSAVAISGLMGILMLGVLFLFASSIFSPSKTEVYRRQLVDLYVAGTIRKLAKKDEIDLDIEYKEFIKQKKKKDIEQKGLDKVIEMEMSEKVVDEQKKALKK